MKTARLIVAAAVILGSTLALHAALAQQPGLARAELQRQDLASAPGREAIQLRIGFAPGVAFGRHWHPGEELIYVVDGALEYSVDGQPTKTLQAGDTLFVPAGTIHSARNASTSKAAEVSTYFLEKGKPLVVMVE